MNRPLISCDTFVCLPPNTANNFIIFGKNSDRPDGEVQEIIFKPREIHEAGAKLQCTYIEIDQVAATNAVILSKPSWMWGAEMGANEYGVVIGNEAVWTKLNGKADLQEQFLGMDLLRLGLERGQTALEAVEVITSLLKKHGQGGSCSESSITWTYHNSFLIADRKEAWVLETVGKLWAAEKVTAGWRNISNHLSIGTKIDFMSPDLKETARKMKWWNGVEPFHFGRIFSIGYVEDCERFVEGGKLLAKLSKSNKFDLKSMMEILRDEPSGICMGYDEAFPSVSSQVSILVPEGSVRPSCHWFTGTPNPKFSLFKPFIFMDKMTILSERILSPVFPDDPAKVKPRFKKQVDRRHMLYSAHETFFRKFVSRNPEVLKPLQDMESSSINTVEDLLNSWNPNGRDNVENFFRIFDVACEQEYEFYQMNIMKHVQ